MRIAQEEIFGPTTALIPVDELRGGGRGRELGAVRALVVDLHPRRQPRLPRDARPAGRDHVHQRGHDRRRGAPAVRRHQGRPATATARRARRRSTSSPSGSRSTSTTRASSSGPRSTTQSSRPTSASSSSSSRPRRSTPCATRCSRPARAGSATTSAAPGTPRAPGRSARLPGANPTVGEVGRRSASPELRLETVFPAERHDEVVAALRARASVRGAGLRRLSAAVKARLYTDGGARGNPGPAAYGYVLEAEDGTVLAAARRGDRRRDEQRRRVPRPRRRAREGASSSRCPRSRCVSDSELLVKQMRGEYRVKNAALRELSLEAARLAPRARQGRVPPRARASRTSWPTASSTRRSTPPRLVTVLAVGLAVAAAAARGLERSACRASSRRCSPAISRSSRTSACVTWRCRRSTRSRATGLAGAEAVLLAAAASRRGGCAGAQAVRARAARAAALRAVARRIRSRCSSSAVVASSSATS